MRLPFAGLHIDIVAGKQQEFVGPAEHMFQLLGTGGQRRFSPRPPGQHFGLDPLCCLSCITFAGWACKPAKPCPPRRRIWPALRRAVVGCQHLQQWGQLVAPVIDCAGHMDVCQRQLPRVRLHQLRHVARVQCFIANGAPPSPRPHAHTHGLLPASHEAAEAVSGAR